MTAWLVESSQICSKVTGGRTRWRAAAVRTKGTYLSAYYRQIMRRRGKQKTSVAVPHKILVIAWHCCSPERPTMIPVLAPCARPVRSNNTRRAIRQLEALGLTVTVEPRQATDAA